MVGFPPILQTSPYSVTWPRGIKAVFGICLLLQPGEIWNVDTCRKSILTIPPVDIHRTSRADGTTQKPPDERCSSSSKSSPTFNSAESARKKSPCKNSASLKIYHKTPVIQKVGRSARYWRGRKRESRDVAAAYAAAMGIDRSDLDQ